MEDNRPNPEDLLRALHREEQIHKRGHLKIFLGMAAGVGKTYAMLEAAQKQQQLGVDVLVGTVNTHGRKETADLLVNLKVLPEKWIKYKDTVFEELDIDEILKLKPDLVIIDELAHSNVPGSRHPKRWQDVEEILDHNIDVYATLNVQHIESLKDVIEGITGIQIRETVPDKILETATNIELIDLTPSELLQRLKEGKVYLGDQSLLAAQNFFKEDRLTALREIVMLFAAEKVDHDLHGMISTLEKGGKGWKTRERLMVAVSHSPHSQRLIRTARRLAFNLDAPWIVLHVDDGKELTDSERQMLDKNLELARELGAEVIATIDPDLAGAIKRIAHQRGITQIIVGRPPRRTLNDFFRPVSLLDRLAREIYDIDVHVIRQSSSVPSYTPRWFSWKFPKHISEYLWAIIASLFIAGIGFLIQPYTDNRVICFIFFIGILILSVFLRKGPVILSTVILGLLWDYFFTEPIGSLFIGSRNEIILLGLFLFTAIFTGILHDRSRKRQALLKRSETSTQAIYEIVRNIAISPTFEQIISNVKAKIGSILNGKCEILVKILDNGLDFEKAPEMLKEEKEKSAAFWVFQNSKQAGWSTSTLPAAKNLYIPLKGFGENNGVLAFHPNNPNKTFSTDEFNFLYTVSQQLANYLERRFGEERVRKIENINQIEKIYQTVLKLISHQFQPPLNTIQESIQELKTEQTLQERRITSNQIHKIENMSEGLLRTVDNISAMAKLSTGMVPIQKELCDIEELINACCDTMKKPLENHNLIVKVESQLPKISINFSLIELLLYNLLFNAIDYSNPKTNIELEARREGEYLVISVADEGKGIPEENKDLIFEKFYQVPGTGKGLGIGLAIAKTIADLHSGHLKAENRKPHGAKFSLYLPIDTKS